MDVRKFPEQAERVETGPIQFGDDWPGVFIRGDNAAYFAFWLKKVLDGEVEATEPLTYEVLKGIQKTLASAVVGPAAEMLK